MTPMQKRVEQLEQDMKYMKSVSTKTEEMIKQLENLVLWLDTNLTQEQKETLLKDMK